MASIINALSSGTGGIVTAGDASGILQLQTANTAAVTIDGSQNVGIGTASPDLKLSVAGGMNLRNSNRAGAFEIDSSGNLWAGTATTAGNIYFETGHSTTGLPSTGTARVTVNQYGLGLGATPSSGTGIAFPATQSASSNANTLDDYEEGTYTPTAIGNSSAGTTTYTGSPVGAYTKIGRQVTAKAGLTYSAMTGTGELVLNLPFTSDAEYIGSVMTNGMNWPAGALSMTLYTVTSTATARVFFSGDDNAWQVQQCVNESTSIQFTVTYFTS
jgi:hypothetical protein